MDDNTKKKQALKVDFSNDVNPDPEQEGEIPDPFNMEDKRVKKWILIGHMLGVSHPLDGKFHEAFIKLQFILPRQIHGNPVLCSNYTASVMQFNSSYQQHCLKVNSNDVNPDPDLHERENSPKGSAQP
jgi:hypothetical protein